MFIRAMVKKSCSFGERLNIQNERDAAVFKVCEQQAKAKEYYNRIIYKGRI